MNRLITLVSELLEFLLIIKVCYALGCKIDPCYWIHHAINCPSQCSTKAVTKNMVCTLLSDWNSAYKRSLANLKEHDEVVVSGFNSNLNTNVLSASLNIFTFLPDTIVNKNVLNVLLNSYTIINKPYNTRC